MIIKMTAETSGIYEAKKSFDNTRSTKENPIPSEKPTYTLEELAMASVLNILHTRKKEVDRISADLADAESMILKTFGYIHEVQYRVSCWDEKDNKRIAELRELKNDDSACLNNYDKCEISKKIAALDDEILLRQEYIGKSISSKDKNQERKATY